MFFVFLAPLWGQDLYTTHGRQDRFYVTEGWIDAQGWSARAAKVLGDFKSYRQWGLKGLDGKDPLSAKYWVQLTDYLNPQPSVLEVVYDVRIGGFLNVPKNTLRFNITRMGDSGVALVMEKPPLGLEDARVNIQVVDDRVVFHTQLRFWGVIDGMMDVGKYRQSMECRLTNLAENLRDLLTENS